MTFDLTGFAKRGTRFESLLQALELKSTPDDILIVISPWLIRKLLVWRCGQEQLVVV